MTAEPEIALEPDPSRWRDLAAPAQGRLRGRELAGWIESSRAALGLPADRPVAATGHQTLLWHPGILVKYLAVAALADAEPSLAAAQLVVDQHADGFGAFEVPVRDDDGALRAATVRLAAERQGVPMCCHPPFEAAAAPPRNAALPSVASGVGRIVAAVNAHRDEPDAARQMAAALRDLMSRWVPALPAVGASDLLRSPLGVALLEAMVEDPHGCAGAYNAAVRATPEAGIGALGDGELPLWRLDEADRRQRAVLRDVKRCLERGEPRLLPRALALTLLVRTAMCDLFVHGTGGAAYDAAMERWARAWLGVRPAARAVATATLRLPLAAGGAEPVGAAIHSRRRAWHDPEADGPGPRKKDLLAAIDAAPRRSPQRRAAFYRMHEALRALRDELPEAQAAAQRRLDEARRAAAEAPIAGRRDWPFPLYPPQRLDALNAAVRARFRATAAAPASGRGSAAGRPGA